jgi:hypothetical protein
VTASASEHPELWRVLKGGGNNFGIVTRFTLRSIPSAPLWVGQMFAPAAFQQEKAIKAYHNSLDSEFDENAAGPIMSFVYLQSIGIQLIALHLAYTKAPEDKKWPAYWRKTDFRSIWSFYRSIKVLSHTEAVERLGRTSPAGTRHVQGTTTIRNDLETMRAAYGIFCETTAKVRYVKGLLFSFTFQAILPEWMNKGFPNIFGLEGCTEPLIIIGCSVTWAKAEDDELVRSTVRQTIDKINVAAAAKKTSHTYRFVNYSMEWQRPYDGLREASQKYDADGLFQTGCAGGFKLPLKGIESDKSEEGGSSLTILS